MRREITPVYRSYLPAVIKGRLELLVTIRWHQETDMWSFILFHSRNSHIYPWSNSSLDPALYSRIQTYSSIRPYHAITQSPTNIIVL